MSRIERTSVGAAPLILMMLGTSLAGCTLVTDYDFGAGIGASCEDDVDCQGGAACQGGICTLSCEAEEDCPEGVGCIGGVCQSPLPVGFVFVGTVGDEGWTLTHEQGRQAAVAALPYLRTSYVENKFLDEDIAAETNRYIGGFTALEDNATYEAKVIVANSFSQRNAIYSLAPTQPDTTFLVCSAPETFENVGSYFARSYQAWYLAGYAAGLKTQTNRLGFMGSFVTPEVVRHIDAFTLGARAAKPSADIVVEVRWEGFWFDLDPPDEVTGKFDEEELAEQLAATGCDVITHNSDNGRVIETVDRLEGAGSTLFSIGNDNVDGCRRGPSSCIGVPYWNWGPMYIDLFSQIQRGTFDPTTRINENVKQDPAASTVSFGLVDNIQLVSQNLKIAVSERLADLAQEGGETRVFSGPINITQPDQRANVGLGETISDEELLTMCWFVEGVVQKSDPLDPESEDVPGRVPWGDQAIPPGSENFPDCRLNQ
jgi:basic membrane protein A